MKSRIFVGTLCALMLFSPLISAQIAPPDPEALAEWQAMRFGMFVHWGPVSLKGTEIGWSRGGKRNGRDGDHGNKPGPIPVEVYDNLYKQFNPVEFDADEWVRIAKAAGMKYLVFTTKHHDGFCMFDSALTDYKIANSPFKRDIVGELAEACHKGGLGLGFYYSQPDWHHPDYRTENHDQYIEYLHGQVREICTNYGEVDIIWFDGLGAKPEDWDAEHLLNMIRELQPSVLINNRAGLPADFDTPEQRIGKFQKDRPWESCITICRQWAWKPNDTMKSLEQCLHTLIRCAGGDGNLLFNVGPMPSGAIEPRQVERLKEMGAWLNKHGDTIYGTRGGPFKPADWCASTCKGKTVFLHLLKPEGNEIQLPAIGARILSSRLLTGGDVTVTQTEEGISLTLAPGTVRSIDTIVELTLDRSAVEVAPVSLTPASLTSGKKTTCSNVFQNNHQYGGDKAVDDDSASRWATDFGTHSAWLAVDLGAETTFDQMIIDEAYASRIRQYELQIKNKGKWETVLHGKKVGAAHKRAFKPVKAREVRLNILKATEGPTINEFDLYTSKKK